MINDGVALCSAQPEIAFGGQVGRTSARERHHLWRPEIQGLRAVGVATVVLFHLWPSLVSGGYVGVDVFFVISGFLITGMLVREAEAAWESPTRAMRKRPPGEPNSQPVALCLTASGRSHTALPIRPIALGALY